MTRFSILSRERERERERERDPVHIHTAATALIIVTPVKGLRAEEELSSEPPAVNAMIFTSRTSRIPEYSGERPELTSKVKSLLTVCRLITIGDEVTAGHGAGMHRKE